MLVCIAVFRFTCCKAKENPRYTGMPDPEFVRRQKTVEKVNIDYENESVRDGTYTFRVEEDKLTLIGGEGTAEVGEVYELTLVKEK